MVEQFEFNSQMLNLLLNKISSSKIQFSQLTNWHLSHPYYRLNYYDNIQISQVPGVYLVLNQDYLSNFDNIVEIGSYNGGLSSYIFDSKKETAVFISYDIDPTLNEVVKKRSDIDFRIGDCFEERQFKDITDFIQSTGRCLVICDGGDKTKEFNLFSKYLKKDDVIMLHDYQHDKDTWEEMSQYWQWPYGNETSYEEIKQAVVQNGLHEFKYKEFNFVAWGSFIKN